tara:strand:+ start:1379 stop:1531 length:153 start_codon:yes stop_codon:yes gene_type:complete
MLVEFAISVIIWGVIVMYVMCGFITAEHLANEDEDEYENIDDENIDNDIR